MPGAPRTNPAAPRGAQADLAARLRQGATALQDRLNSRDTLIELIRSVNATLEPKKVAEALLGQAHGVVSRADAWSLPCRTGRSARSLIAERGPCDAIREELVASRDGSRSTTKSS